MRYAKIRRWVGAGLSGTMLLAFTGCSVPLVGSDTIKVTALMSDSAGLFVGNDVGILGVPVGKVTSITPDGTVVRVTMSVKKDQAVPASAGAVVVARSVATDRYVELTPVYHSGAKMADGAVIQQPKTRTPVDFDDVLGALNTFATGIAGTKDSQNAIKNILESGSTVLDGRGKDFNRAVTSLGGAVDSISSQRGNITSTVKSLDSLTSTIAANQDLVKTFIGQVSNASALLADERLNFQSALRALSSAVEQVAVFAHGNRQQIVKSLNQSTALMGSLLTKRPEATEILKVMPVALQNLENVYDEKTGRLRVRVDPTVLLPIGGLVNSLCTTLPTDICADIGPSLLNLQNLLTLLGGKK